jgi:hypothetical protein
VSARLGISTVVGPAEPENQYLTRSARLRACNGWLARFATSSSAMVVELGGWDHL